MNIEKLYTAEAFKYSEKKKTAKGPNFFSRSITFIKELTPLEAIGLLIAAIVLSILFPVLAPPFYFVAISLIATRFIWKIGIGCKIQFFDTVERKASSFQEKHRYFQFILFGSSVLASYFISVLGCIMAIAAGVFSGIVLRTNHLKRLMKTEKSDEDGIEINTMNKLLSS